MQAIHGVDGRIGRDGKAGHASIWCDIIKEMDRLASQGIDLVSMMQIKIGNGSNTSFWEDRWRGGKSLKEEYPRFPVEDRWKWVLNGSGVFTVASARQYIDNKRLPGTSSKTRWIKEVPIKVNIHAWKVSLDGLPTHWNISRRGVDTSSILCPLCLTFQVGFGQFHFEDSFHSADLKVCVEGAIRNLMITILQGANVVVRDVLSTHPYVVVSLEEQWLEQLCMNQEYEPIEDAIQLKSYEAIVNKEATVPKRSRIDQAFRQKQISFSL
nr:RNA-directed DNA polymerase, eukaryota [Tanacetum cinerariifolium]